MNKTYAFISVLAGLVATSALAENKQYQVQMEKGKKEATVNLDKSGTLKFGGGEGAKRPESSMSERDRRQEQQHPSGQVFLRKTF